MAAVRMQIATTETGVCVYDVRGEFDFHLIIIESQFKKVAPQERSGHE